MTLGHTDLPKPTPAEEERQQKARAVAESRAKLSEEERVLARAAQQEEVARGNMTAAVAALADSYAMRGEFDKAAKLHPNKEARARFRKWKKAVTEDDDKECKCKPQKFEHGDIKIELPKYHEVARIFSKRHGAVVPVEQCRKCSFANARPATTQQGEAGTPDAQSLRAAK